MLMIINLLYCSAVSHFNSAIWKNNAETVSEIVQKEPAESLSKPNQEGWIHLHEAAYCGYLDCLKVLVKGMAFSMSECCCHGVHCSFVHSSK